LRIIVGITGASGSIYGIRLLERLRENPNVETHLVVTRSGERTVFLETGMKMQDIRALSDCSYAVEDIGALIASGSVETGGMVVVPCSVHSMSGIARGISSNLLLRAADVTLKERRRLILVVRETPLHLGHLRTMTELTEMGAIVAPPVPAFYTRPETVRDIVDHTVNRVLDLLGLPAPDARRWAP
jgi:4-hydroxy-3-polyprenylbenzoate decarboxylase